MMTNQLQTLRAARAEHEDAKETASMVEKEGRKCLLFSGDVGQLDKCREVGGQLQPGRRTPVEGSLQCGALAHAPRGVPEAYA